LRQGFPLARSARSNVFFFLYLFTTALIFPAFLHAQDADSNPQNLNLLLDSVERAEEQNPARTQAYEITREYKVFRGHDPNSVADITAQISFTPPDIKTFQITEARGNPRAKEIVNSVLEQEVTSAKEGEKNDISRSNYNFAFVRKENFGAVPEYVLHIVPKRKEKGLLLGDIWVDAESYHIRQIIGVPVKSPSFWIKNLHITIQFAALNGLWIPGSVDAIATIRLLGLYILSGLDLAPTPATAPTPTPTPTSAPTPTQAPIPPSVPTKPNP